MKKLIIFGLIAAAVVAGGLLLALRGRARDNAYRFRAEPIERGLVQATVTASGSLSAVATVQVGTQVSGTLEEISADFNTAVSAGQQLARIEPSSFQAQADQAVAAWTAARAGVQSAEADLKVARSAVDQAVAALDLAKANKQRAEVTAQYAGRTLQRYKDLVKNEAASELDLDTKQNAYEQAAADLAARRANVAMSQAELQNARSRLAAATAQIAVAKARRDQAKAELDLARVNLERTVIRSPIDGIVVKRAVDVGQTVAASFNTPTLFEIAKDLQDMQIEADVDEADIGGIQPDRPVLFTVEAYPDETFRGTVSQVRLSPKIEQSVVTYTVIVSARNPHNKLLPGMTANLTFLVDQRRDVLRIPNAALRFQPPAQMVAADQRDDRHGSRPTGSRTANAGPPGLDFDRPSTESAAASRTGSVWRPDGDSGLLRSLEVTLGLADARFTELAGDELKQGDEVITAVYTQKQGGNAGIPFVARRRGR